MNARLTFAMAGLAAGLFAVQAAGAAETKFTLALTGGQETPPNASTGTGSGTASYDDSTHIFKYSIAYSGLADVAAAHFHGPAAPGKAAPPTLPIDKSALASPIAGQATLTDAQAKDLLAGNWYFNVHTKSVPGGEIRGQVTAAK